MVYAIPEQSKMPFSEVAIADLKTFQIAILTSTKTVYKPFFSHQIPVVTRHYQSQGWIIWERQLIASFERLTIGSIFHPEDSPYQPPHRIATTVPLSFQVCSSHPLPSPLSSQAAFMCSLPKSDFPYHSVFHMLLPSFVRTYPLKATQSLLDTVERMLAAKIAFTAENYDYLKQQSS